MLNFKKIAVVVLALSSSVVFAGTMGPVCSAAGATTPCEGTSWDFGAYALFLQPSYSAGDYSYVAIDTPIGQYQDYRKSSAWGFFLEGSYHYSTGSDVNLNWYHISKSENRDFLGAFEFIDGPDVEKGRTYIDPKWDAFNVEFGQHVDFGENKTIRFHGGFQYARITIIEALVGESLGLTHDLDFRYQTKSTYSGFGARAGADMGYALGYGLSIYSNVAAALLEGSEKINVSYIDNLGISSSINAAKRTVVPELEAKVGVKYDYVMALGDLTFDLAWMWINYFNATQVLQNKFVGLTSPSQIVVGDFGFQGVFFGLHWLGNGL